MSGRNHNLPLYYQISREIIEKIQTGELLPGMRVPSENEIVKKYEVSNTTARKILNEIESLGWALKIKGKGTFVQRNTVERSATRILSFTKNMIEAGYTPSTKILETKEIADGYSALISGRKYTIKGPVFKIHRLRYANNIPMMMEVRYISKQFCPDIENQDFSSSLYDNVYEKVYKLRLSEVVQELSAIMMDTGIKEFFDVKEATPAFLIEGVTFCGKEMILEMEKSIYRGDKYKFTVRAT